MDREPENTPENDATSHNPPSAEPGEDRTSNLTELDPDEANRSGVYDTAGDREDHT